MNRRRRPRLRAVLGYTALLALDAYLVGYALDWAWTGAR